MNWLPGQPVNVRGIDHRVKVHRRIMGGFGDSLDVMFSGRRWSWSCDCDHVPCHAVSQQYALGQGLVHLDRVHGQRAVPR